MSINLFVGELQRVATQLEDAIRDDLEHHDADDRHAIAAALSDVAVELELARLTVLGPIEPEDGDP